MNVLKRIWFSQVFKLSTAHILAGIFITLVSFAFHASPVLNLIYTLMLAFAHEQGDGDLFKNSNHPKDGIIDMIAFLPGPIAMILIDFLAR